MVARDRGRRFIFLGNLRKWTKIPSVHEHGIPRLHPTVVFKEFNIRMANVARETESYIYSRIEA